MIVITANMNENDQHRSRDILNHHIDEISTAFAFGKEVQRCYFLGGEINGRRRNRK